MEDYSGYDYICYCDTCGDICLRKKDQTKTCITCKKPMINLPDNEDCDYFFNMILRDDDGNIIIGDGYWEDKVRYLYVSKSRNLNSKMVARKEQLESETKALRNKISGVNSASSSVTCPYCKSTNVTKISTAGRVLSVGLFGLGSSKVGKQWHCNQCKSDF